MLEITESVLLPGDGTMIERLNALSALGVHLYIDDFGTGYSSLSYLQMLPVNGLKLAQEFVETLPGGDTEAGLVRTIQRPRRDPRAVDDHRRGHRAPGAVALVALPRLPRRPGLPPRRADAGRAVRIPQHSCLSTATGSGRGEARLDDGPGRPSPRPHAPGTRAATTAQR